MRSARLQAWTELIRFAIVGLLNNFFGYFIYLALTWSWMEPRAAVSILYPIGALSGYFGQARYAFSYSGSPSSSLLRYIAVHMLGYLLNVTLLWFFADHLGISHQIVQAAAILVVASLLFVLLKYYVFPADNQKPAR